MRVCVIGMFPPPIHGMAVFTKTITKRLDRPVVINLSPQSLARTWKSVCFKAWRVACGVWRLLWNARSIGCVYLAFSGGFGQIYDVIFIAFSRVVRKRLVIHHHAYSYIARHRLLTAIAIFIAGDAVHVVACDKMAKDLRSTYRVRRISIVSGVVTVKGSSEHSTGALRTVGFLSNLSEEKGISEFLAIARRLGVDGIRFRIAGAVHTKQSERDVRASGVEYVGPVYGSSKDLFLRSLDVLLFPTRNESEGIVMHEAMSYGIPVIATSCGCIPSVIRHNCGAVFESEYVERAIALIRTWVKDEVSYQRARDAAANRFRDLSAVGHQALDALVADLTR